MFNEDVSLADTPVVDYTAAYNDTYGCKALAVHAARKEMLVVWPAPNRPIIYGDTGRKSRGVIGVESYTLESAARPGHDDFAAVKHGPDTVYFNRGEARPILRQIRRKESLFKVLRLFP